MTKIFLAFWIFTINPVPGAPPTIIPHPGFIWPEGTEQMVFPDHATCMAKGRSVAQQWTRVDPNTFYIPVCPELPIPVN